MMNDNADKLQSSVKDAVVRHAGKGLKMSDKELKPCPFCGSRAIRISHEQKGCVTRYSVECCSVSWTHVHEYGCIIQSGTLDYPTEAESITAWNTRNVARPAPSDAVAKAEAWLKNHKNFCTVGGKDRITDLIAELASVKAEIKTGRERAIRIHDCHRSSLCSNCRLLIKQMTGE